MGENGAWSRIRSGLGRAALRVGRSIGDLTADGMKGLIKDTVSPYIDALEEEGFSRAEFQTCVHDGISFYDTIMWEEWKVRLLKAIKEKDISLEQLMGNEEAKRIFMAALGELREWFPRVITRAYFENECHRIMRDMKRRR